MKKTYVLALDLGTTGNRALVFDKNQNCVSSRYEEFPQIFPKPGWVEHDADQIWKSTQHILKKTLQKISAKQIEAIGITNQRETVVIWDKKTGKPIHNAIVWQCRRTADFCASLKKRGYEKMIHERTGLFLDAYFSASKITWLLDHVPGARRRAEKGELLAGTIDSWIVWNLSGGQFHVTDTSNASRTMLFNIKTLKWDDQLCKLFRVPKKILPNVVPSSVGAGFMPARGRSQGSPLQTDMKIFKRPIPISGIIGDQQAAAFAQGCFEPGIIKNTYGTGLFMLENTGLEPKFSKNLLTTVAWSLNDIKNTEYAVEGSVFIGGAAIQWLRDGLGIIKNASETEKMAKSLPSNEGVYFVPALVGLGAPYWDPHARGTFTGITRGTTRAHFVRAALESIAFQTRDILEVMKKDTRKNFKLLRVDGGATRNNFLMQFQADILGIPVERPVVLETTALGAAALAGLAVGFWKDRQEFNRLRRTDHIFKPSKKTLIDPKSLYLGWLRAVHQTLSAA